jgi:hypothetical protein
MGLCLPATAEPEGYSAEKAKGNIVIVPGQGNWHFDLEVGALDADRAAAVEAQIEALLAAVDDAEDTPPEDLT